MCLDTTVLVWGRKLREQDAGVLVVLNAARPEREDSKDSHWRQPLISDSQAFVPEMTFRSSGSSHFGSSSGSSLGSSVGSNTHSEFFKWTGRC